MIFISGCETYTTAPKRDNNWLVIKSLPPFPSPKEEAIKELIEVCPYDKCIALYDWLGKIKVLQEQLDLYKDMANE